MEADEKADTDDKQAKIAEFVEKLKKFMDTGVEDTRLLNLSDETEVFGISWKDLKEGGAMKDNFAENKWYLSI